MPPDTRHITIEITPTDVFIVHRHNLIDVAHMVQAMAKAFEADEDLAIIFDCAINLYRKNTSTKIG